MQKIELRISKRILYYFWVIFFLATPAYFLKMQGVVNIILIAGELLTYIYILYHWIIKNSKSASILWILTVLLYGYIIVISFIYNRDMFQTIRYEIRYIFTVMFVENEAQTLDRVWKTCIIYLLLCVFINYITILIYPMGMNTIYYGRQYGQRVWFFANKNGLGKYLVCLLFFKSSYDFYVYQKLSFFFYIISALSILSVISMWSATSIVCVSIMVIMLLFSKKVHDKQYKWFNIYIFMTILLVLMISFVIFNNVLIFSNFLVNVLRKSITFNERTYIWSASIIKILENPIFGYGYLTNQEYRAFLGISSASDSHNFFLTMAIYGGAISTITFLILILYIMSSINKDQYSYSSITLTAFLFSFFLIMIFENTSTSIYWMILAYGCIRNSMVCQGA